MQFFLNLCFGFEYLWKKRGPKKLCMQSGSQHLKGGDQLKRAKQCASFFWNCANLEVHTHKGPKTKLSSLRGENWNCYKINVFFWAWSRIRDFSVFCCYSFQNIWYLNSPYKIRILRFVIIRYYRFASDSSQLFIKLSIGINAAFSDVGLPGPIVSWNPCPINQVLAIKKQVKFCDLEGW